MLAYVMKIIALRGPAGRVAKVHGPIETVEPLTPPT
jgi:hypothetical protein